jgi:hypothetical protein
VNFILLKYYYFLTLVDSVPIPELPDFVQKPKPKKLPKFVMRPQPKKLPDVKKPEPKKLPVVKKPEPKKLPKKAVKKPPKAELQADIDLCVREIERMEKEYAELVDTHTKILNKKDEIAKKVAEKLLPPENLSKINGTLKNHSNKMTRLGKKLTFTKECFFYTENQMKTFYGSPESVIGEQLQMQAGQSRANSREPGPSKQNKNRTLHISPQPQKLAVPPILNFQNPLPQVNRTFNKTPEHPSLSRLQVDHTQYFEELESQPEPEPETALEPELEQLEQDSDPNEVHFQMVAEQNVSSTPYRSQRYNEANSPQTGLLSRSLKIRRYREKLREIGTDMERKEELFKMADSLYKQRVGNKKNEYNEENGTEISNNDVFYTSEREKALEMFNQANGKYVIMKAHLEGLQEGAYESQMIKKNLNFNDSE